MSERWASKVTVLFSVRTNKNKDLALSESTVRTRPNTQGPALNIPTQPVAAGAVPSRLDLSQPNITMQHTPTPHASQSLPHPSLQVTEHLVVFLTINLL